MKIMLKNCILFASLLLIFQFSFAQTKKEQIENLILQKDSLSSVLEKERQLNSNQVKLLEAKNSNQKDSLTKELKNLGFRVQEISLLKDQAQSRIDSLIFELKKITSSYRNKEAENAQLQRDLNLNLSEISALKNQLIQKTDRIGVLTEELQNLSRNTQKINFPENNFDALLMRFGNKEKNVSEYTKWLIQIVAKDSDGDPSFVTTTCLAYISEVMEYNWGLGDSVIDEKTLKSKWENQYDLKYSNFGHLFENGNGGWGTKKLTKIEYLGELNNGDWFKLTIEGGCGMNDYSNTLIRIIKVVKEGGNFYIDNFLSLSDN
jgi:hypothetical protein